MYHWVIDFAPARAQKYLGYITGWLYTFAWQAGAAALNLLAAQLVQGIISLWQPTTEQPLWHVTALALAFGVLSALLNTAGAKQLPLFEFVILILHFFGILVVLVPLWALAPKSTAKEVFQGFDDNGGLGNVGFASIAGQIGAIFSFSRVDGGTHIGLSSKNAPRNCSKLRIGS